MFFDPLSIRKVNTREIGMLKVQLEIPCFKVVWPISYLKMDALSMETPWFSLTR